MTVEKVRPYGGAAMAIAATVFIGLTMAAAFMGSQFMPGDWYEGLAKPSWTPPNGLFGPVWGLLYIMIAAAGFIAWRQGAGWGAVTIWVIALILNGLWSPIFFGAEQPLLALIIIGLLWLAVLAFILATRHRAWMASLLFLPYLLWITYAASLNAGIVALNP
jgi:tryptophan-rich sensory protein